MINLMQRWVTKLEETNLTIKELSKVVKKETDGSFEEIAKVLGCTPAEDVDPKLLQTMTDRWSIYGDVWQSEELDDIQGILVAAGNGK